MQIVRTAEARNIIERFESASEDSKSLVAFGPFPTLGFQDTSGPFASDGTLESDFTKPVDPTIDWVGKDYAELLTLYDGSGGGAGVDISGTGLPWILYMRISVPDGLQSNPEIDAFADVAPVPEPSSVVLFLGGLLAVGFAVKQRRDS